MASGLASLDLSGLTALVTGGGAGLGRHMTLALASAGANLVICGRHEDALSHTVGEVAAAGGDARAVVCDVTDTADLDELVAAAGHVDILVNNVGGSHLHPWYSESMDDWRAVMALNLESALQLCQRLVPAMCERRWGRVVNVASVYGSQAGDPDLYPGIDWDYASYFTSKHGLIGLTRYLAVRVAPDGVCVNSLSPGMFPTVRQHDHSADSNWERMIARTPMKRLGVGADIEAAVVFLASPGASFVTGHDLRVDGGWSIW
jgi:NAD(P)-dependent dehydrogenase (short-subunit alcohol dehydrogenase family)